MKKFFCIVCTAVLLFALTGCTVTSIKDSGEVEITNASGDKTASMFVVIEKTSDWCVVYHRETKVMYTVSFYGQGSGVFTLLVNADGTPMLFEG